MDFILKNYLIIILVGLFFVFALVGYLIDMLRNNKEQEKEDIQADIKLVEIKDINVDNKNNETVSSIPNEIIKNDDADDLLKNYDEFISE